MSHRFRARFDGKALAPEEPPVGRTIQVEVVSENGEVQPAQIEARIRRLEAATGFRARPEPTAESLRREHLYDESD